MRFRVLMLMVAVSWMAGSPSVQAVPVSAGNGYIVMVHATFEPNVNEVSPVFVPPAQEALMAMEHDGYIVFNVIPHRLDGKPVKVSDPVLEIMESGGAGHIRVAANGVATNQRECAEETAYKGFEGPIEACQVFRLPASSLEKMPLVDLGLWFTDGAAERVELHNTAAHGLLHGYQQGSPLALADVDSRLTGKATPFAIQSLFER